MTTAASPPSSAVPGATPPGETSASIYPYLAAVVCGAVRMFLRPKLRKAESRLRFLAGYDAWAKAAGASFAELAGPCFATWLRALFAGLDEEQEQPAGLSGAPPAGFTSAPKPEVWTSFARLDEQQRAQFADDIACDVAKAWPDVAGMEPHLLRRIVRTALERTTTLCPPDPSMKGPAS